MLVKILFLKVPTFRLKLQPSSGESNKEFVEKASSYTMQIGKSELIMFSPLGLNLKIRAANEYTIITVQRIPTSVNFPCF